MIRRYLHWIVALTLIAAIALLAKGQAAWAGQSEKKTVSVKYESEDASRSPVSSAPGSVKPPPSKSYICANGLYSVGGVVTLEIKDLKANYCIDAELWDPGFQINLLPQDAGKPLAHLLFLQVFFSGTLAYEVPAGDGIVEACYAIPPEKSAQFYFYDFYGERFEKRTEPPTTWDILETRIDTDKKTACAFTQVSGVYSLVGQ